MSPTNGGGTEWAEAAARMVTAVRLKSERIGFVRGPHWENRFAYTVDDLQAAAKSASRKDQAILNGLAEQAREYQREAASPCDSYPLWQGKRPSCTWLGVGFFASGLMDLADPEALKNKVWAKDFFTPMQYPYEEGVWRGPLIVLVNAGTGSAAEEFAAVLQDNRAAVIIGAPTAGAGCGHTNGGTPPPHLRTAAAFSRCRIARDSVRTDPTRSWVLSRTCWSACGPRTARIARPPESRKNSSRRSCARLSSQRRALSVPGIRAWLTRTSADARSPPRNHRERRSDR